MTALDSGFHSEDSGLPGTGFQSLSVELGFWIPVVRGIPGSWSRIPDSKTNFPRFWISQAKISWIPESVGLTWALQSITFISPWTERTWDFIFHMLSSITKKTKQKKKTTVKARHLHPLYHSRLGFIQLSYIDCSRCLTSINVLVFTGSNFSSGYCLQSKPSET